MKKKMINRFKHQNKKSRNYFEGWYLRVLDVERKINIACIFAYTNFYKDPHAFIQYYDGVAQKNHYYRFPLESFSYSNNEVVIEDNCLSLERMVLSTADVKIDINLTNPIEILANSAMSYLSKLPLECYQEVVFMDAEASGKHDNQEIFGRAYMEKTYGKKFPKKWFWLQANDFDKPLRFTLAGGRVPTLFLKPFGFFAIIQFEDKEWCFGTYNLSKCRVRSTEDHHYFTLTKGSKKVIIEARLKQPVKLVGPSHYGNMNLDVYEDLFSEFKITLYEDKTKLLEATTTHGGFEWMFK